MVDLSSQQLLNRPVGSDQIPLRELKLGLVMGFVVLALILACCYNKMQIVSIEYAIEGLMTQNNQLLDNHAALLAEYESSKSPEKILAKAYDLGMISSSRPDIRIIEAEPVNRIDPNLRAQVESSSLLSE
jgi:hypothetical protein